MLRARPAHGTVSCGGSRTLACFPPAVSAGLRNASGRVQTGFRADTYLLPENPSDLTPEHVLAWRVTNDDFLAPRGNSSGGGYSTAEDLLRFDQALRSDTLLTAETVATLIEGKVETPLGPDVRYGYGFVDYRSGPTRIVGHGGGAPGISAKLDMYWDFGATVVALSNYDGVAELVSMKAKRLLAPG